VSEAPEQTTVTVTPATPAEAKTTEQPSEHMIPKSRFDEINTQLRQLQTEKQEREAKERAETEKRAREQGKYEELLTERTKELDALRPQVETATERARALEETMAAQIKDRVKALSPEAQKVFARLGTDVLVQFAALPEIEAMAAALQIQRSPGTPSGPRGTGASSSPTTALDEEGRRSQGNMYRNF
jgi:DNA mismatch repair ATPase MutS